MTVKTCFKCDKEKPLSEFYKHPRMADRHVNKCKDCNKSDNTVNRRSKLVHYRAYDNKRYATQEKRRKSNAENARKFRRENPEKYKAQCTLNNAVRDGKITKPDSCSICGTTERIIHGHHEDYTKPLEVVWCCPPCHKRL